jgi:hypothetical protein
VNGGDRDLFGDLLLPEPERPAYMDARPAQAVRLFEPQMEGQLDLLDNTTGDLTVSD